MLGPSPSMTKSKGSRLPPCGDPLYSSAQTNAPSHEPRMTNLILRDATEADLPAILAIYNHAVAETTAIWNETLIDLDSRRAWLELRRAKGFPVLVAE
eukprot:gene14126-19069_t